jgi:hypothetical protein
MAYGGGFLVFDGTFNIKKMVHMGFISEKPLYTVTDIEPNMDLSKISDGNSYDMDEIVKDIFIDNKLNYGMTIVFLYRGRGVSWNGVPKGYTQEDIIETSSKNYQSKDLLDVKNEQTTVDQNDNIPQSQDVDEIINENYPYVDIDELTSIDIMESHMRENNDYDRGLREIVYDADKNVILLMQHDYYR